jgi:hypothetical protein
MLRQTLTVSLLLAAGLASAQTTAQPQVRLDSAPKWYEIVGDGNTSGSVCPVRSMATRQVIGAAEPQFRFLSFGQDANWIVFAFKGVMGYVPSNAAEEVYPGLNQEPPYHGPGKTLEQQAEEEKKKADDVKDGKLKLAPNFTNQPTPKPTVNPMQAVPGAGVAGGKEAI